MRGVGVIDGLDGVLLNGDHRARGARFEIGTDIRVTENVQRAVLLVDKTFPEGRRRDARYRVLIVIKLVYKCGYADLGRGFVVRVVEIARVCHTGILVVCLQKFDLFLNVFHEVYDIHKTVVMIACQTVSSVTFHICGCVTPCVVTLEFSGRIHEFASILVVGAVGVAFVEAEVYPVVVECTRDERVDRSAVAERRLDAPCKVVRRALEPFEEVGRVECHGLGVVVGIAYGDFLFGYGDLSGGSRLVFGIGGACCLYFHADIVDGINGHRVSV